MVWTTKTSRVGLSIALLFFVSAVCAQPDTGPVLTRPRSYYAPYLESLSHPMTPWPRSYSCVGNNQQYPDAKMSFSIRELLDDEPLTPFNVNGWPTSMYLTDDAELPRDWAIQGLVFTADSRLAGTYQVVVTQYGNTNAGCASTLLGSAVDEVADVWHGGYNPLFPTSRHRHHDSSPYPAGLLETPAYVTGSGVSSYSGRLYDVSASQIAGGGMALCARMFAGLCLDPIPFCCSITKDIMPESEISQLQAQRQQALQDRVYDQLVSQEQGRRPTQPQQSLGRSASSATTSFSQQGPSLFGMGSSGSMPTGPMVLGSSSMGMGSQTGPMSMGSPGLSMGSQTGSLSSMGSAASQTGSAGRGSALPQTGSMPLGSSGATVGSQTGSRGSSSSQLTQTGSVSGGFPFQGSGTLQDTSRSQDSQRDPSRGRQQGSMGTPRTTALPPPQLTEEEKQALMLQMQRYQQAGNQQSAQASQQSSQRQPVQQRYPQDQITNTQERYQEQQNTQESYPAQQQNAQERYQQQQPQNSQQRYPQQSSDQRYQQQQEYERQQQQLQNQQRLQQQQQLPQKQQLQTQQFQSQRLEEQQQQQQLLQLQQQQQQQEQAMQVQTLQQQQLEQQRQREEQYQWQERQRQQQQTQQLLEQQQQQQQQQQLQQQQYERQQAQTQGLLQAQQNQQQMQHQQVQTQPQQQYSVPAQGQQQVPTQQTQPGRQSNPVVTPQPPRPVEENFVEGSVPNQPAQTQAQQVIPQSQSTAAPESSTAYPGSEAETTQHRHHQQQQETERPPQQQANTPQTQPTESNNYTEVSQYPVQQQTETKEQNQTQQQNAVSQRYQQQDMTTTFAPMQPKSTFSTTVLEQQRQTTTVDPQQEMLDILKERQELLEQYRQPRTLERTRETQRHILEKLIREVPSLKLPSEEPESLRNGGRLIQTFPNKFSNLQSTAFKPVEQRSKYKASKDHFSAHEKLSTTTTATTTTTTPTPTTMTTTTVPTTADPKAGARDPQKHIQQPMMLRKAGFVQPIKVVPNEKQ